MKKLVLALVTIMAIPTANAGLMNMLSSTVSKGILGSSASSSADVPTFLQQAHASNLLFQQSRAAIAAVVNLNHDSSEILTKLKALQATSDPKEQNAIIKELAPLTDAVMQAVKNDEQQSIEVMKQLSAEKKKVLINAATNFAIASLMAADLAPAAKQITMSIVANPSSITSNGFTVSNAQSLVTSLVGISKNSSLALVETPRLFKKAGIDYTVPSSSKTKAVPMRF